ncbi:glutamate--cysteine ligase [Kitasatospora sp. NPDC051853]|uniref:glutamate--cysteine ligase n=1 Tax=Kitasatospora sp. NPDC051853 TaxID=3364058 RepID=UPI0037B959C4
MAVQARPRLLTDPAPDRPPWPDDSPRRPTGAALVPTLGVEEEFLLVDPDSRAPVARAPEVLAGEHGLGALLQAEFYTCQIEVCTEPVRTLPTLRAQLLRLRGAVARAAADSDCRAIGSGCAPLAATTPIPVTDTPRYRLMARHFGSVVDHRTGTACGCHIHLGVHDKPEALLLSAHLRPWLPALQALAANSPVCQGKDTGHASWRALCWAHWPTVGPAPVLDAAAYEALADSLVSSRLLLDRRMIYWFARPSEHVPTLEVRIADVSADPDTTVLLAGLVRGLVARLRRDVQERRPVPAVSDALLRAAHGCAARAGLGGAGLDPHSGRTVHQRHLLDRLVEYAGPGLAAAGDLATVTALLERTLREGTGADRQRAVLGGRGRAEDVVDFLADAFTGHA